MITQEELKERLNYDPETGIFVWKKAYCCQHLGKKAGYLYKRPGRRTAYITFKIDGKSYLGHRLAWLYMHGEFPENHIDHIDGDGSNNKISNLRCVSQQENCRNAAMKSSNKSGFCGVFWHKQTKKWQAKIRANGKYLHLGLFVDKAEAVAKRKEAEKYYGFHENHGRSFKNENRVV